MNKAKEISALWEQIKPQIDEMVHLCYEVESHYEVTADAYQRGYEAGREAEKVRQPDLEQVRKEAYDDGYNAGYGREIDASYQEGLSDAWEAARKICLENDDGGIPASAINDIFNVRYYRDALRDFSASECIEKIRQYEQEKEEQIQVGDEVNAPFGKAIVVNINSVAEKIWLVYADGHGGFEYFKDAPTKTGRHFPEIAEVLRKMKEADNG